MSSGNSRLRRLLFLSIQIFLVLALFEGGLRFLEPRHRGLNSLLYIPPLSSDLDDFDSLEDLLNSSIVGFTPYEERAGFILNSRSFRTKEYIGWAKSNAYRIMCLGDSFTDATVAVPYADMWHARLERHLNQDQDREFEVLSLGVPGVGPSFSLRVWQFEQAFIQPDLVIFALFIGNDITDEQGYRPQRRVDAAPARLSYTFRLARNLFRVWEQSQLGRNALVDLSKREKHERGGVDLGGMWPARKYPGDEEAYLNRKSRFLYWLRKDRQATFSTYLEDVRDVLYRFSAEVRNSGSDFMVMIIPDEFQAAVSVRRRSLKFSGRVDDEIDVDSPQRYLREVLERARIPYLDLLPGFREAGPESRYYLENDGHWNVEGNHSAARALATYVKEGLSEGGPQLSGNIFNPPAGGQPLREREPQGPAGGATREPLRPVPKSPGASDPTTPPAIAGFIDAINYSGSPSLKSGESLVIRGWAVDQRRGAPVPKVEALVNGMVIGATTEFHNRPDVVGESDRPDYEKSGWVIRAKLPGLTPGRYQLEARVVMGDGSTGPLIPKAFDVVE